MVAVNSETQPRISDLEVHANILHREVAMEEVDVEFAWILDLALTQAWKNLYVHTIETWWQMKTITGLAMQEQEEWSKTLESKIGRLTEDFVVYVKAIHHCRFITQDALNYTVIKKKLATKVHLTAKGSSSINKEDLGASTSRRVITRSRREALRRLPRWGSSHHQPRVMQSLSFSVFRLKFVCRGG